MKNSFEELFSSFENLDGEDTSDEDLFENEERSYYYEAEDDDLPEIPDLEE